MQKWKEVEKRKRGGVGRRTVKETLSNSREENQCQTSQKEGYPPMRPAL